MKMDVKVYFNTSYDDGTNKGSYCYLIAHVPVAMLASASWKLRVFSLARAAVSKTCTAEAIVATSAGTLPAIATRSLTITAAGVWTLGTNETATNFSIRVECKDVEDDSYPDKAFMAIASIGVTAINIATSSSILDEWVPATFGAESSLYNVRYTPTAAMLISKTLPDTMALYLADYDLVTREYSGKYLELAAKGVTTLAQVASKEYAGLAAQITGYATNGNAPHLMELTALIHPITIGVGI